MTKRFLNVTGAVKTLDDAIEIGRRIKTKIRDETGLTASVGVAPNKFLAKLASDLKKPDGLAVISEEEKVQVLAPMPVSKLWGVGPVTEERFHKVGLRTIGDIQRISVDELRKVVGNSADRLHALSLGEDDRKVETEREVKSIGSEHTFDNDTSDLERITKCLLEQCEEVGSRLRNEQLAARTVQLKLRYADFTTLTRRQTLATPTQDEMTLYEVAMQLLGGERIQGEYIRLIGVSGSNLVAPPEAQTNLFDQTAQKRIRLAKAVDDLRAKLDAEASKRGRLVL